MRIEERPALLGEIGKPIVLAAGFFDGLHRGHWKLIEQAVVSARALSGQAWVLTFDKHPASVLRPGSEPVQLTSIRHKLTLMQQTGADGCLLLPFTRRFSQRSAESFIQGLGRDIPELAKIVVGRNWRFGEGGRGDHALLCKLATEVGFEADIVRAVHRGSEPISSTRIRSLVRNGDLEEAGVMLGRHFSILGKVERGRTVGRRLGFPTANLGIYNEALPPMGVYAVYAVITDGNAPAKGGRSSSTCSKPMASWKSCLQISC